MSANLRRRSTESGCSLTQHGTNETEKSGNDVALVKTRGAWNGVLERADIVKRGSSRLRMKLSLKGANSYHTTRDEPTTLIQSGQPREEDGITRHKKQSKQPLLFPSLANKTLLILHVGIWTLAALNSVISIPKESQPIYLQE